MRRLYAVKSSVDNQLAQAAALTNAQVRTGEARAPPILGGGSFFPRSRRQQNASRFPSRIHEFTRVWRPSQTSRINGLVERSSCPLAFIVPRPPTHAAPLAKEGKRFHEVSGDEVTDFEEASCPKTSAGRCLRPLPLKTNLSWFCWSDHITSHGSRDVMVSQRLA